MLVDIPAELDARVASLKTQLHDFDRTGDVRAATSEPLAIEYVANLVNAARQALRSHAHEQAQQWLLECEHMTREDSHWLSCFGPQERVRTALRAEVYVLLAEHSIQTSAGCVQAHSFLEFAQLESDTLPATLASAASLLLDMGCPELALAPAQSAVYTLTREVARIGNTISNVRKCTVRVTVRERHRLVTELCRACGLLAHCYCVLSRAHGGPGASAARHRTAALHQALHYAREAESAAGRHAIFEQGEHGYRSNDSDPYWANGIVDYRTATPELPQLVSQTRTGSLLHGFTEVPPPPRRVAQFAEKALPAQEASAAADVRFDGVCATGRMVPMPPVRDEAPSLPEPVFHVLHPLPPGAAPAQCPQSRPHRRHGPFADLDFGVGPARREGKLCVRSTPRATIVVSTGTITMGSAQVSHALAGDIHQLLPPGFFGALLPVHCMVACDARGDMYVTTVCKKAALRLNGFEVGTAVHALSGGDKLVLGAGEGRVEIHVKKTPERGHAASPQTPPAPPPGPPPNRLNQRRPSTSTDDSGSAGAPLVTGHSQIVRRSSGIIGRILINKYDPGREWTELASATLPQYLAHLKDEMDSEQCALGAPNQQTAAASTEPAQEAPPQPRPPPPPTTSPLPCIDKVFATCTDPATELPFLHSLVAVRNSLDPASLPPSCPRGGQEGKRGEGEGHTTPPLTFTEKCELMYPVPAVARSHAGRRVSVILESDEGDSATTSSDSSSTGSSSSSGSGADSRDSDTDCHGSDAAADDAADGASGAAAQPPDGADALSVLALACSLGCPEDQRHFAGLDAVSAALAISCPGQASRLLHEEKAHVDDAPSPSPPSPVDRETPGAAELEETLYSALRSVMGTIDEDGVDTSAAPLGLEKDDVNDLAGPPTPPLARSGTLKAAPALAAVLASFPSGDGGVKTYLHGVSTLTPSPLFSSFSGASGATDAAASAAAAAAAAASAPRKKSFVVFTTEPDEIIPPSPCVCTPPPGDSFADEAAAEASARALRLVHASLGSEEGGSRAGSVGSYLSGVAALAPTGNAHTTDSGATAAAAARTGELGVPSTLPALRHLVDVSREPETGRQTCHWLPFVAREASPQPGSPTDGYPAMHVMLGDGEGTGYPSLTTLLGMTTGP